MDKIGGQGWWTLIIDKPGHTKNLFVSLNTYTIYVVKVTSRGKKLIYFCNNFNFTMIKFEKWAKYE